MPIYLMLTTLTEKGVQTLKSNPGRLREVNRDVEELGARVLPGPAGRADAGREVVEEKRRTDSRIGARTTSASRMEARAVLSACEYRRLRRSRWMIPYSSTKRVARPPICVREKKAASMRAPEGTPRGPVLRPSRQVPRTRTARARSQRQAKEKPGQQKRCPAGTPPSLPTATSQAWRVAPWPATRVHA